MDSSQESYKKNPTRSESLDDKKTQSKRERKKEDFFGKAKNIRF